MRWTREDCSLVRFATPTVDCETRPLKKRAKWRRRRVTRRSSRRVWSSPHFPIRSAPAAAEPAAAAVRLGAGQAEKGAPGGTGGAGGGGGPVGGGGARRAVGEGGEGGGGGT